MLFSSAVRKELEQVRLQLQPSQRAEAIGRIEDASLAVVDALERIAAAGEANPSLLCNPG